MRFIPDFAKPVSHVVGIIHTLKGFHEVESLQSGGGRGFAEFRADLLQEQIPVLAPRLSALTLPLILTVRAAEEGGFAPKDDRARAKIYLKLLDFAHAVDIELFKTEQMQAVSARALEKSIPLILSYHNFEETPSLAALQDRVHEAAGAGGALCKIATMTNRPRDLGILLELLSQDDLPLPLSVMGMGKFGKISRPLLAQAGSRLNYGYIDRPTVSGQWSAGELQRLIDQLEADQP